jgi:dipeptidyl aminopeptidase/acylaminoacyl peptidase
MDDEQPRWERRFRAPQLSFPTWSPARPERLVTLSTETGVWQALALDLATGERRTVTDHPVGVVSADVTPDGERVIWWQDETGDEEGRWLSQRFAGGASEPLLEGVPVGWNEGFSQVDGVVAASISGREGFAVYVSHAGAPAVEIARSTESLRVAGREDGSGSGGLSADGALLCLEHSEHGDMLHPALRVVDPRDGSTVADLMDPGLGVTAAAWSPVPGDERLAIVHERRGHAAAAVWEPRSGNVVDVAMSLPGEVTVFDWWPDGSALLLAHLDEGRHQLFRLGLGDGGLDPIDHEAGQISAAAVRPDGTVWLHHASGAMPPRVLAQDGSEVVVAHGPVAPGGQPYRSFRFDNPHGDSVHGFYVTPEGEGPWPIWLHPHGGPTWLDEDRWNPEVQAYVDMGFAVALINYRGSTGYGAAWRDALTGDIGGPELEDCNAGLAALAEMGVADLDRAVVGGWSWGGYLTLMELGKHPELWRCGVAGVPVGDYEMSYDDMSPSLQAYDRALLGGEPGDVPELMADRNPIVHVDAVVAPVLFLIGENDSRCPYRQAMAYVDRLAARDHPHEVYVFGTGHVSFDLDEEVRQMATIMAFAAEHVPGVEVPAD